MQQDEPIILVCAPATTPLVAPGATFAHACSECKQTVVIAPSGQRFLKENSTTAIVCAGCYKPRPEDLPMGFVASAEELKQELTAAVPNLWRNRN